MDDFSTELSTLVNSHTCVYNRFIAEAMTEINNLSLEIQLHDKLCRAEPCLSSY